MHVLFLVLMFLAGCIPPLSIPVANNPGDGGDDTDTGTTDGGDPDGGTSDGGGTYDGGGDGGDAGSADGGDTGTPDGGTEDGGTSDGGTTDGGTDTGTTDGGDPDGGTSDGGGTYDGGGDGGDAGSADGGDTGDTGVITPTVHYAVDFGDGASCSTDPFARSDGGAMTFVSYDDGVGGCGVYVFGSGSASGPSISLDYSSSGYTPGTEYTATMTLENLMPSSITVYTDFGGGSIVSETVAAGGTGTITVTWPADSSGSATLRVWDNYSTNYGIVAHDLVITY